MLDFTLIHIVAARDQDCEFAFQAKKQAQGPWIIERWGWNEELQRDFHRKEWNEQRPSLITCSDIPIGTIRIAEDAESLVVSQFFLLPEHQGKGIGSFILQGVLCQADKLGKPVSLTLLRGSRVESLYRRMGFQVVAQDDTFTHMKRPRTGHGLV